MATIRNADGTVGNVISANKFMMDNNLQAKYRLLQSYSDNKKKVRVSAGGTGAKGIVDEVISPSSPSIVGFISKLEKFYFSPPSDNLWTINIDVEDSGLTDGTSITVLFDRIKEVNDSWRTKVANPMWKINTDSAALTSGNTSKKFIQEFIGAQGVFLAQNVQFSTIQATVNKTIFPIGQQHGGFFNFGSVAQSRPNNRSLNINFLVSNWDIGDILFDPWIAAVTQKGLIEDGNSSIKAKIVIKEYSSGMPKEYTSKEVMKQMQVRKQYIFRNCVPISRGEISKNYESSQAGTFKSSIVNFIFDDYEIIYNY